MTKLTTKLLPSLTSMQVAVPRYATPRRLDRPTFGPAIAKVAADLGRPLMPWQSDFAMVLGEYNEDTGIPYYSTGFFTVPRRSGKTLLLFAWSLRRMLRQANQRVAWSAQSRSDARELWIDELYPLLKESKLAMGVARMGLANGGEYIKLKNGSVMRLVAPGEKSGHGKGLHASAEDELMADMTAWRSQVFGPAMLTVPDSQSLKTSAAGTQKSVVFNAIRRAGREAVAEGADTGICYLEYSADNDWDFENPETFWRHMPALGHTITVAKIRSSIDDMLIDPDEGAEGVRRAYGNITAGAGSGSVIPNVVWQRVCDSDVHIDGTASGLVLGVAVSQDRSASSIAVASKAGEVELLENRGGTGWVIDRANELSKKWRARVVLDGGGPAGALADNIKRCNAMNAPTVIKATGAFFDAVVEMTGISVHQHPLLDAAVEGAVKKEIGDRFVWSRSASTEDVTPLEAATLAWSEARHQSRGPMIVSV